ncbi:MAG: hypothetical protein IJW40_03990 [Clostridia bacterium]|nr:hypothetical protein [Clostridia bacterium]
MLLFRHFLKKYSPWLILTAAVLLAVTRVWEDMPPPQLSFVGNVEMIASGICIVPIAFILFDATEIELGIACGIRTSRFAFTRFLPCLMYTLIPATVVAACYRYVPKLSDPEYVGVIPIYVPDNYSVYLAVSAALTVLFFASLTLLLRVVMRNSYIALAGGLVILTATNSFSNSICAGILHPKLSYYDPFVTTYFVGDYLGNHFTSVGVQDVWTVNRVLFLLLSIGMLAVSYAVLRREKLHEVAEN